MKDRALVLEIEIRGICKPCAKTQKCRVGSGRNREPVSTHRATRQYNGGGVVGKVCKGERKSRVFGLFERPGIYSQAVEITDYN